MAAPLFIAWGGITTALTAPLAGVTPAAANTVKTVLQIGGNPKKWRVVEWGYAFTSSPTGVVTAELIETGTVPATVTAGNIAAYNDASGASSQATATTTTTGYNASAEGTITATRLLAQTCDTAQYFKQQFPLGREPEINASLILRLRIASTVASLPLIVPYIIWEE